MFPETPHSLEAAQRYASQGGACPLLGALSRRAHSSVDEFDPNGCGALAGCARRLGSRAARGVCAGLELNSGSRSTLCLHGSRAGGEFLPVRGHAIRSAGMTAAGLAAASQCTSGARTTARTQLPLLRASACLIPGEFTPLLSARARARCDTLGCSPTRRGGAPGAAEGNKERTQRRVSVRRVRGRGGNPTSGALVSMYV